MLKLWMLPITIPLRVLEMQLRIMRGATELTLDLARNLSGAQAAADLEELARRRPVPAEPGWAAPSTNGADEPSAAATVVVEPPAPPAERPERPAPRRAARKATADRPARERASEPTKGEVAAMREAQREAEAAEGGTDVGPGPEINVQEPWEGYDAMALDEVLGRLQDVDEAVLALVRLYESQHENRQAILLATGQEP